MSTRRILSRATLLLSLWVLPVAGARAAGSDSEEARAFFDKASASFALGHYAVAAENYEKAFELKTDPALLYNAAQAHRLAGNKERALILYQNYLRLYARALKRTEVEGRIEELKKAIERDREVATSPPTTTMPSSAMPASTGLAAADATPSSASPATSPATGAAVASSGSAPSVVDVRPAPLAPQQAPTLLARPAPAESESQSITRKPLFWAAAGAGIVAVIAVVLIVALSGPKDPSPSLGVVR